MFHHQPVIQNVSDTAIDLTSVSWFNKVVIDGLSGYNAKTFTNIKTEQSDHCFQSLLLASLLLRHFHVWPSAAIIRLFRGKICSILSPLLLIPEGSFLPCTFLVWVSLPSLLLASISDTAWVPVSSDRLRQPLLVLIGRGVIPSFFLPLFWNSLTVGLFHVKTFEAHTNGRVSRSQVFY